jgi:hypothetical protein
MPAFGMQPWYARKTRKILPAPAPIVPAVTNSLSAKHFLRARPQCIGFDVISPHFPSVSYLLHDPPARIVGSLFFMNPKINGEA